MKQLAGFIFVFTTIVITLLSCQIENFFQSKRLTEQDRIINLLCEASPQCKEEIGK